jgi:hypothetical protein
MWLDEGAKTKWTIQKNLFKDLEGLSSKLKEEHSNFCGTPSYPPEFDKKLENTSMPMEECIYQCLVDGTWACYFIDIDTDNNKAFHTSHGMYSNDDICYTLVTAKKPETAKITTSLLSIKAKPVTCACLKRAAINKLDVPLMDEPEPPENAAAIVCTFLVKRWYWDIYWDIYKTLHHVTDPTDIFKALADGLFGK